MTEKIITSPQEEKKRNEKVITLPNREEMLARLLKTDADPYLQEKFYPILLKDAGQKRNAMGVVMMLALAIHDYSEGMPPIAASLMYDKAPSFIDALIDDPEAAKEAKAILQEAVSSMK